MAPYLADVLCSNCQAAGLDLQDESTAVCRYCETVNPVPGVICPHCECINAAEARTCDECHQSLYRQCPQCGTSNWAGAEACLRCQNPLDAVAALGARYVNDTAGRLRAQQRAAADIKNKEAADSQRRMAELNAIEQRRQQHIGEDARVRDVQQRLWIMALIVLGFIVIAGTIIFLAFIGPH